MAIRITWLIWVKNQLAQKFWLVLTCHDVNGSKQQTSDSRFHEVYQSRTYQFCSEHCMTKFRAAPSSYTNAHLEQAAPASAVSGIAYACPMHSEEVRGEPGRCPKCGMALEMRET